MSAHSCGDREKAICSLTVTLGHSLSFLQMGTVYLQVCGAIWTGWFACLPSHKQRNGRSEATDEVIASVNPPKPNLRADPSKVVSGAISKWWFRQSLRWLSLIWADWHLFPINLWKKLSNTNSSHICVNLLIIFGFVTKENLEYNVYKKKDDSLLKVEFFLHPSSFSLPLQLEG